ncbi:MAG: hypothetical protein NVSMB48_27250 [Marmoricola sp.]
MVSFGRHDDGFTPLDGLVMATRSGSVDPGLLLWLLDHTGLGENEMAEALEHESGLLALCGSADMRTVVRLAGEGDGRANLALEVYEHRPANDGATGEREITDPGSRVRTLVVQAREDLEIGRQVSELLVGTAVR